MLRKVIENHEDDIRITARQPGGILRGLGYMSKYIEDFLHDPTFLAKVSEVAGEPLCPSTFGSHIT